MRNNLNVVSNVSEAVAGDGGGEADVPGKGRLHGGDEGCRRPPRPKSCRGRKGGEKAMVLALGAQGDIIHCTRHL